jgi:protein-S-isoprenylcysteine O-methyltransferase Ste14
MVRIIGMAYGLACYLSGLAALGLFILFANNHMAVLGNDALLSLNIDRLNGPPHAMPLLTNLCLLLLFGLQHSVMARRGFKVWLTRFLPSAWERSTYVLATAVILLAMVQYWQPMAGELWRIENEAARIAVTIVYYAGWIVSVLATWMINHFHLFGLQQSFSPATPDAADKSFRTPLFYRLVRHPIQTGVLIAMLATPDMTSGRAVLAAGMIVYIFIGLYYEEKDLIREFGDTYRTYRERVGGLLPRLKRR